MRVLKQVMEEKLDHHNVQLAQVSVYASPHLFCLIGVQQVTPSKGFQILNETQLKEVIDAM